MYKTKDVISKNQKDIKTLKMVILRLFSKRENSKKWLSPKLGQFNKKRFYNRKTKSAVVSKKIIV